MTGTSQFSRRGLLRTLAMGTAAWTFLGHRPRKLAARAEEDKPNIVFILADDLGWKDVGFMGSTYYETPNIDKLARQGVIFTGAYTNGPNCAPTRASLLSGQYTPRHGVLTVGSSERGPARQRKLIPVANRTTLGANIVTPAEALKGAGYTSASMGKWHLGNDPDLGPVAQGFDVNVAGYEAGAPRSYFSPYRNPTLRNGPEGEYLTDRLTDEALAFIETHRDRPFFLYLPHYAVHTPLQARQALIEEYRKKPPSQGQKNATYAAMVESLDQGVGRIMEKLDELDLTRKTVVFFFSDNGGVKGITSMTSLRGGKGMLYEGGIRVPLVVRWPGVVKAGRTCDELVIGVDFYPTLLALAGAEAPEGQCLDGQNLLPLLRDTGVLSPRSLFWHFPAYLQGRADGARDECFRTRPAGAVRRGRWKLIEYFEDSDLELYDLKNDIGETKNLAAELPEKTKELHRIMTAWRQSVNAPMPTRLNPKYDPG